MAFTVVYDAGRPEPEHAEAWLSLVRSRASALLDDGQLVDEVLMIAGELLL